VQRRFQLFGGARVNQLSVSFLRIVTDATRQAEQYGINSLSDEQCQVMTAATYDLLLAMRIDLGVDKLDLMSDEWFNRSEIEARHNQYRHLMFDAVVKRKDDNRDEG
jgi:hypothetical protein